MTSEKMLHMLSSLYCIHRPCGKWLVLWNKLFVYRHFLAVLGNMCRKEYRVDCPYLLYCSGRWFDNIAVLYVPTAWYLLAGFEPTCHHYQPPSQFLGTPNCDGCQLWAAMSPDGFCNLCRRMRTDRCSSWRLRMQHCVSGWLHLKLPPQPLFRRRSGWGRNCQNSSRLITGSQHKWRYQSWHCDLRMPMSMPL